MRCGVRCPKPSPAPDALKSLDRVRGTMAHRIDLSEGAYRMLTALKSEGESYSDVVQLLASSRRNLAALEELSGPREDLDLETIRAKMDAADHRSMKELLEPDPRDDEAS